MNNIDFPQSLIEAFSKPRLKSYLSQDGNYQTAFALYQENVRVSAALMPVLHYLEVILRNRLDVAVRNLYGNEWLLSTPTALNIDPYSQAKINSALQDHLKKNKTPPSQDDLVAALTLGFWYSMFNGRYDTALWHKKHFFAVIFPQMPRAQHKRNIIQSKLLQIRDFRNRIAHHEPIIGWKNGVEHYYALCIELIQAMSPEAIEKLRKVDCYISLPIK